MRPKVNNCAKCGRFTSRKDRKVNKTKAKCRLSAAVRQRIRQMQKLVPFQIMKRRRVPKMRPSSNQRGARAPRCRLGQEDALTKTTSSVEEEEIKVSPFIKGIRLGLKVGRQQYNQDPAMTAMSHDKFQGLMQTTQLPNLSALYSPAELLADNMTSSNQRGARAPPCRLRQKDALTKTPSMSALEEEIGISPFVKGLRLGLRHGRQEYNQDPTMTAMSLDGFKGRMQTTQLPNLSALYSPAELMAEERCSMPLNPLPPGFVPKSERGHNSSPQELQQDSKQELDEKSSEVSEPKRELPGSVSELAESVLSLMQDMSQNWSTDIRQSPRDVLKNDDRNDV